MLPDLIDALSDGLVGIDAAYLTESIAVIIGMVRFALRADVWVRTIWLEAEGFDGEVWMSGTIEGGLGEGLSR